MGISLKAIAKIKMEKERWLVLCIARYSEEAEYGRNGRNAKRGLLGIYQRRYRFQFVFSRSHHELIECCYTHTFDLISCLFFPLFKTAL